MRIMAQFAALQSLSSASVLGQTHWSSASVKLKVTALPLRLHTRLIRCHVEDLSPKELHQIRKKEALKKLRKIRKERRAKSRAEELAKIPRVTPNPATLKFQRPLVDWNKPRKQRRVSASNSQNFRSRQGLGFEQGRNGILVSTEPTNVIKEERLNKSDRISARHAPRIVIGQRKGADVYLSIGDDDAKVKSELPREDLDEDKQLQWLAKQLDSVARPDGVHFSRVIRSGGLKITDGRSVILVQKLGELGNWRRALQVVEWLDSRNRFPAVRSRHVYTALLTILGKARRPAESLNVFNAMRDQVASFPDLAAYRVVAVTLGQAGYLEELLELIQTLRDGPGRNGRYLALVDNGRLIPDVVVYNAALNACVAHKHWRLALWILDQLYKEKDVWPNSTSYGLAIEVMVKGGKMDLAWKLLEKMELEGFHPNSLTYKALVEGLGRVGKADVAVQMVKQMEQRGMVAKPGVYFALAATLCTCGQWQDALLQVDRISSLSGRPPVQTYTGLIMACKESGRWRDAIAVFEHMQAVCAPNIGTCNVMISLYGAHEMYLEARSLFDEIKKGRISPKNLYRSDPRLTPDAFTYDAMLGACTNAEEWRDLEVLFRQMLLQGYQLNSKRHAWIVQALSEAGQDDLVAAIFSHLRSLNAATAEIYTLMIKSCLSGGLPNEALSHLDEMVDLNMRVSTSHLEKVRKLVVLLPYEEDRSSFLNKVEGLKNTSDFIFADDSRQLKLRQHTSALKQLKTRHLKLNPRSGGRDNMTYRDSMHRMLQDSRDTSIDLKRGVEKSFHAAPFSLDNLLTPDWPSKHERGQHRKLQNFSDDLRSTAILSDSSRWELLWKRSSDRPPASHMSPLVGQLV